MRRCPPKMRRSKKHVHLDSCNSSCSKDQEKADMKDQKKKFNNMKDEYKKNEKGAVKKVRKKGEVRISGGL